MAMVNRYGVVAMIEAAARANQMLEDGDSRGDYGLRMSASVSINCSGMKTLPRTGARSYPGGIDARL